MIVDGYVRVSQVSGRSGEGFISPAVQREQIERWATLHGALIGRVFEEFDESGGRRDRPLLEEAISRVERGESEGLVVAYMSRFGRSSLHGLTAIARITQAGGSFVSVQEGFDFSTDIGRHMLRTMLSWAEWTTATASTCSRRSPLSRPRSTRSRWDCSTGTRHCVVDGGAEGTPEELTDELMAAVGRLMRRG